MRAFWLFGGQFGYIKGRKGHNTRTKRYLPIPFRKGIAYFQCKANNGLQKKRGGGGGGGGDTVKGNRLLTENTD